MFIIGNWKMYGSGKLLHDFLSNNAFLNSIEDSNHYIGLSVPFNILSNLNHNIAKDKVKIGAQDVSSINNRSLTGNVSAQMLKDDCKCSFAIVGHSSRRDLLGETNQMVYEKILHCLNSELTPVVCIGEQEKDELLTSLNDQLSDIKKIENLDSIIIAYEPVWSIGGDKPAADTDHINNAINIIRNCLGNNIKVLYGGSVNHNNAQDIKDNADINGFLIGSASRDPEDFASIINSVK